MICRQCMFAGLLALITVGCSETAPPAGVVGHVRAYFGGIAADEPEAVLIARDVLSAGGSAVDAVVSMVFTMMVTRPDAAGPGGGGMCVVFHAKPEDGKLANGEAIEFLPRAPKAAAPTGRWPAATPGSFRGLFALHARYGQLRWEQLVLPAERLARFGVRIPRVLTKGLAGPGKSAIKGRRSRALYFNASGAPLVEGDVLRQVELAGTLSRIRRDGPGVFYSGPLAREFADGVEAAGGWLEIEDLRSYRPVWIEAGSGMFGPHNVYFLPSPAAGGEVAARMWSTRADKGLFGGIFSRAGDAETATGFAAMARQGYAAAPVRPRYGSTTTSAGALAVDRLGNSAACVLTMDQPFGSGRLAGNTGVMPIEPIRSEATLALSAMIVANRNTKQTFMAATGAGDQFASSAMMGVVLKVLDGKAGVETALSAARIAPAAGRSGLLVEPSAEAASQPVTEVPRLGQVNIMSCPDGVVSLPDSCVVRTDPRGFGHAINAEF